MQQYFKLLAYTSPYSLFLGPCRIPLLCQQSGNWVYIHAAEGDRDEPLFAAVSILSSSDVAVCVCDFSKHGGLWQFLTLIHSC